MPVSLGDVFRVTAKMTMYTAYDVQNVFYFRNDNGDPLADSAVIQTAQEVMEAIYTFTLPYLSASLSFDTINVFIPTGNQALGDVTWPTLTQGGDAADPLAPGVALLSLGRTGISRSVGRKYWGVSTEAHMIGAQFSATAVAGMNLAAQQAWGSFVTSFGAAITGVVYDKVAAQGRGVISIVSDANAAYQRRRRFGAGS